MSDLINVYNTLKEVGLIEESILATIMVLLCGFFIGIALTWWYVDKFSQYQIRRENKDYKEKNQELSDTVARLEKELIEKKEYIEELFKKNSALELYDYLHTLSKEENHIDSALEEFVKKDT